MIGLSGSPLRKPYSIGSAPWEVTKSGIMQVLVQVEDSGGLDPHLELASPGTPLDLDGPFGSFGLPDRIETPLLFIAGGTGIQRRESLRPKRLRTATGRICRGCHRPRIGAGVMLAFAGTCPPGYPISRSEAATPPSAI